MIVAWRILDYEGQHKRGIDFHYKLCTRLIYFILFK